VLRGRSHDVFISGSVFNNWGSAMVDIAVVNIDDWGGGLVSVRNGGGVSGVRSRGVVAAVGVAGGAVVSRFSGEVLRRSHDSLGFSRSVNVVDISDWSSAVVNIDNWGGVMSALMNINNWSSGVVSVGGRGSVSAMVDVSDGGNIGLADITEMLRRLDDSFNFSASVNVMDISDWSSAVMNINNWSGGVVSVSRGGVSGAVVDVVARSVGVCGGWDVSGGVVIRSGGSNVVVVSGDGSNFVVVSGDGSNFVVVSGDGSNFVVVSGDGSNINVMSADVGINWAGR
jgi:hypothetical protein